MNIRLRGFYVYEWILRTTVVELNINIKREEEEKEQEEEEEKEEDLLASKLDLNLMKNLVKCYLWSTGIHGDEI
jgi:hypothetical protein